jgi:hypothetical protein
MDKKITNKTLIKQLNKKYNSVEVDGVFYWFDDEIKGEKGWNYNFGLNNVDNLPKEYPQHSTEWNFCRKIIAQSQNKLEGVPTILLMNYHWNLSLKNAKISKTKNKSAFRSGFVKGYKSNLNQYNQKDIYFAINMSKHSLNYSSEQILEQINSISVIELDEEFNIISYE